MSAALHKPSHPIETKRAPFGLSIIALAVSASVLSACAKAPPPAPPPPPPPPPPQVAIEQVPYRPLPPGGAHYVMTIPARGADGRRITINSNLTDDQLVWNLRSAWNVAALNCLSPEYQPILDAYRAFLNGNIRALTRVNDRIEKTYTSRHKVKRDAIVERDGYTTQVYNFFALPAARSGFCRAALDMSNRALLAPPTDPLIFAKANFDGLLTPFDLFFVEYEAYEQASGAWDAKWGALFGASQPGWVAVQQARASGAPAPSVTSLFGQGAAVQTVIDPLTGVPVPVIPVTEGVVSQPVIEPIVTTPESGSAQ